MKPLSRFGAPFLKFDTILQLVSFLVWPCMMFVAYGFASAGKDDFQLKTADWLMIFIPLVWVAIGLIANLARYKGKAFAIVVFRIRELIAFLVVALLLYDNIRVGGDLGAWSFSLTTIGAIAVYYFCLNCVFARGCIPSIVTKYFSVLLGKQIDDTPKPKKPPIAKK